VGTGDHTVLVDNETLELKNTKKNPQSYFS